ncbi:MAG TPA: DUF1015 domain-containing protein, partial [Pirellulaceae bacterium]
RLILNRDEPGDPTPDAKYQRAARFLRNWRSEGILREDPQPAIYVYQQTFTHRGKTLTRSGFMSRVRIEPFGQGRIFPHEETHAAAKADRLKLLRACRTNLSQIFGLYPDPDQQAGQLLEQAITGLPPVEATDHLGVVHRVWAVTDQSSLGRLGQLLAPKPMFIADGHHRYETAANYRQELSAERPLPAEHPANYVLMMCVSMNDPGMIVLPTHRLFRGLPDLTSEQLQMALSESFDCRLAGEGPDLAEPIWREMELSGQQGTLAFFTAADERWTVARIHERGRNRMAEIAADRSAAWRSLGVSLLQRLVIDTHLSAPVLPQPMYVHSVDEAIHYMEQGDTVGRDATGQTGSGGKFPLVALVMPATLEHVRSISELGERMPAKSTYFY